uniref:Hexosyltransferase n=1 Tax=Panagrellus redivivus TaxID=6233 RepID=A0A7E4UQ38_PANRE
MLLAPIEIYGKLRQIGQRAYNISKHRFDYFTAYVYITDSDDFFLKVPKFFENLVCKRFDYDKLRLSKKTLCVTKTLYINVKSTDKLEDIVPLISGSYSLLYINGNVKWHQLLSLIYPETQTVLIMGKIELNSDEVPFFVIGLLCISKYTNL